MKTLQFANGDQMPIFGLGTWNAPKGMVYEAVKEAIRVGYRHIDCSPIYANEAEVGRGIAESIQEGIVSRQDLWVTSKLWNNAHRMENVQPALEKTLSDLQLDYLDLYLVHWPVAFKKEVLGPKTGADMISLTEIPLSETWEAMEALLDKGLVRHIGVSNFSVKKLTGLLKTAKVKPEMNQVELHPYLQQKELVEFCKSNTILVTAYSPLGSPGRPDSLKAESEPLLMENPVIVAIAARLKVSPAQVLINWAMSRNTAVIPKSTNPVRIQQNLDAVALSLSEEDMAAIAALDNNFRYVTGKFWTLPGSPYTIANLWDE